MTDRPAEWAMTTLREVLVTAGAGSWGQAPGAAEYEVRVIRNGDISRDGTLVGAATRSFATSEFRKSAVREGDVLITTSGDIGKVATVGRLQDERLCASNFVRILRPQAGRVTGAFLGHFLATPTAREALARNSGGTTLKNLRTSFLDDIQLPIPPLPEQERIVAAIEEKFSRLDAGVAALERVQIELKRMRESVLGAAASGSLVTDTPAQDSAVVNLLARITCDRRTEWEMRTTKGYVRPVEPSPFKMSIPTHWRVASLEALTDAARVICYGILMPKDNVPSGVPYVRVKDMRGWTIDVRGLHRTASEIAAKYARASLVPGDILIAIRGSYGRVALIPPELNGANITQDSARIALHPSLDRRYLLYYLGGPVANRYYRMVARGVAVKGVNIGDLRAMPVPIPPLAEQAAIADAVESQFEVIDRAEETVRGQIERSRALRSSTLAAAFSGQLVARGPDDEPASVLLDHIAAEAAAATGNKRGRTKASTNA